MTRTNWITWLGALGAVAVLGATQAGCNEPTCGTGTIDMNGACVPANDMVGSAACGAGTHLGATSQCVPDLPPTQCDPDSTEQMTDPMTGITTCVGTGGTGCQAQIACGTPSASKMTICGQFFNIEDNTLLRDATPTGANCDPSNPTPTGPCSMQILAYDAIDFATNGMSATPLPNDEIVINNCGQFRIKNVNISGVNFVGIGLEDNVKATPTAPHRLSGVALPAVAKAITNFPAYDVKNSVDQAWTSSAGLSGSTFVDRGVYMALFTHGATPVAGVKITVAGGTDATNDYYFSDTDPASRMTVAPAATATGANGAGLMIGHNMNLTNYSGTGMEPTGCMWPTDLGDQITNVAFIQPRVAQVSGNSTMICP